jgi:2-amino-4-hydroxy-6-hydroxymethyldihydropteridine diphosphokinase
MAQERPIGAVATSRFRHGRALPKIAWRTLMPSPERDPNPGDNSESIKTVYLSLGSNLEDRAGQIAQAVEQLGAQGMRLVRQSSLYETETLDLLDQGWFLNCVIEAKTDLMPRELLQSLLEIERSLGRRRRIPRGPRTIDVDILLYGSSVIRLPDLEIPHPRMAERRFVLVPLAEISPDVRHPVLEKTIAELLAETSDRSQVRPYHGNETELHHRSEP